MPRLYARSALVDSAPVTGLVMSRDSLPPAQAAKRTAAAQRSARPGLPLTVIVSIPGDSQPSRHVRGSEPLLYQRPEHLLLLRLIQRASLHASLEGSGEEAGFAFLARLAVHRLPRLGRGNPLRFQSASGQARRDRTPEQRARPVASDLAVVEISQFPDARHGSFDFRGRILAGNEEAPQLGLGAASRREELQSCVERRALHAGPGAVRTARFGCRPLPEWRARPAALPL